MKLAFISISTLAIFIVSGLTSCKTGQTPKSRKRSGGLELKDCENSSDPNCNSSAMDKSVDPGKGEDDPDPLPTLTSTPTPTPTNSPEPTPSSVPPTATPDASPTPLQPVPIPSPLPTALKCSATTIHYVGVTGRCKPDSAAFAADDNRDTVLACCPLPASDILAPGEPVNRGGTCGSQEIAVGASNGSLLCAPINTAFYTLAPSQATCYFGKGASGGSGATKCVAPSDVDRALVSTFGTDACLPSPYGGLITKRTSKYCRDVSGAVLLYKTTNKPVPMFQ